MKKIAFVGNCQLLTLSFYLQHLLRNNKDYCVRWVCYSDNFIPHLTGTWDACSKNKITNANEGVEFVKDCDYIFYNPIKDETSTFFSTNKLKDIKKESAELYEIISMCLDYNDLDNSINHLKDLDKDNEIQLSAIIEEYKHDLSKICLTFNHPTTLCFLKLTKEISRVMNIDYYNDNDLTELSKHRSYTGL
jgi:hypothetical protein